MIASILCQESIDYQMNWLALLGVIASERSIDEMIVGLGLRSKQSRIDTKKLERDRIVTGMRDGGMSFGDISRATNCPKSTVQEICRRAV